VLRIKKLIIIIFSLVLLNPLYGLDHLRFGLFPVFGSKTMLRLFSPIAQILEEELGIPVSLVSAPDKATFNERTLEGDYHLVWTCNACYFMAHDEIGLSAIARGYPSFTGIVLVRKDSGIEDLSDLAGKKIAAISPHSMAGYLFLRNDLAKLGLHCSRHYSVEFNATSESIPFKVHSGTVDAGVLSNNNHIQSNFLNEIQSDLNILHESIAIPQFPFAVIPSLETHWVEKIQDALILIDGESDAYGDVMAALNYSGVEIIDNSAYDEFREIYYQIKNLSSDHKVH